MEQAVRRTPYLHLENFLPEADVERLLAFVREHEGDLNPSTVLAAPGDEPDEVRRSRTLFNLEEIWPMFESQLEGLLPTMRKELDVHWFRLSHIERQLTVHHDGDFFGPHNDNGGPEVAHRTLTYVYYFNAQPKQFSGGELWMYDTVEGNGYYERGEDHVVVEPLHNSIIFFPSWAHHEVRPVKALAEGLDGCRMTVNGWYHARPHVDPMVEHAAAAET